jgi:hypothetical protein
MFYVQLPLESKSTDDHALIHSASPILGSAMLFRFINQEPSNLLDGIVNLHLKQPLPKRRCGASRIAEDPVLRTVWAYLRFAVDDRGTNATATRFLRTHELSLSKYIISDVSGMPPCRLGG